MFRDQDSARIERLKAHITTVINEIFLFGISEMDTCFYNCLSGVVSAALDHTNCERELTSQFLAVAVGDAGDYPIPRNSCELGFIVLLQRVEGLFKDVPDVLELLSVFMADERQAVALVLLRPRVALVVALLSVSSRCPRSRSQPLHRRVRSWPSPSRGVDAELVVRRHLLLLRRSQNRYHDLLVRVRAPVAS